MLLSLKNIIEDELMHPAKYEFKQKKKKTKSNVTFSVLKFDIFFSSIISIK